MRRSIIYRILLLPLVSTVFLLIVSGAGVWSLRLIRGSMESISGHDMIVLGLSKELRYPLAAQSNDLRGFLITHTPSYLDEAHVRLLFFSQSLDQIKRLANDPREREIVNKLEESFANLQAKSKETIDAFRADDDARGLSLLMNDMRDLRNTLETLAQDLDTLEGTIAQENTALAAKTQTMALIGILLSCLVSLAVTWLLGFMTARRISQPLRQLSLAAQNAATGDLTVHMPQLNSGDEVAQVSSAFNTMVRSLSGIITEVGQSSSAVTGAALELNTNTEQVARAARSVSQAMDQVARGATCQSSSAQEASHLCNELKDSVARIASGANGQAAGAERTVAVVGQNVESIRHVAERANNVLVSSRKALESARDGSQVMERTLESMDRIRKTVLESGACVRKLGEASTQIGAITNVITGIADQTNLLALNAAIEAARAGEHGRGFAVVAEEVRKLAEGASRSAGEISHLIGNVLKGTTQAVTAMESGVAYVNEGTEQARQAGTALSQIVVLVEQTTQDVASITSATGEIAAASDNMTEAVNAMARTTRENITATEAMGKGTAGVIASVQDIAAVSEENAAAAEEVSASTEEMTASAEVIAAAAGNLRKVAAGLHTAVSRFKV